jgi:hypothetical protein
MSRYIALRFDNDEDGARFFEDVQKFGSVPIPDGRQYGEYPCTARDITRVMDRIEQVAADAKKVEPCM